MEEFIDDFDPLTLDSMVDFMKKQQETAVALTKLVLEYSKMKDLSQEQIFDIFKKSSKVVIETFSVNEY